MKNKEDAIFEQRAYLGVRDLWKNRIWRGYSPNSALFECDIEMQSKEDTSARQP